MTDQKINKLTCVCPEDFPEGVRDLIPIIGINVLISLIKERGGESVYIPKWDRVLRYLRDRRIISEFDGSNYKELAKKYNLTSVWIRELVGKNNKRRK